MRISRVGNKRRGPARGEAGVTLLELLVVLALMALLVGLVAPGFGRATDNWRLRRAAESVAQILRYARTRALYDQRYYVVEIRPAENRVRLLGTTPPGQAGSGVIREYLLPADMRCGEEGAATASVTYLVFSPSGAVEERTLWLRNRQGRLVQIHLSFLLGGPGVEVVRQGA